MLMGLKSLHSLKKFVPVLPAEVSVFFRQNQAYLD